MTGSTVKLSRRAKVKPTELTVKFEKIISHFTRILGDTMSSATVILFDNLYLFQTLPPIKTTTIDQDINVEEQRRLVNAEFWERPSPPKPFIVHLGVTCRTHDIIDFQTNFPDDYPNFCIDRYNVFLIICDFNKLPPSVCIVVA